MNHKAIISVKNDHNRVFDPHTSFLFSSSSLSLAYRTRLWKETEVGWDPSGFDQVEIISYGLLLKDDSLFLLAWMASRRMYWFEVFWANFIFPHGSLSHSVKTPPGLLLCSSFNWNCCKWAILLLTRNLWFDEKWPINTEMLTHINTYTPVFLEIYKLLTILPVQIASISSSSATSHGMCFPKWEGIPVPRLLTVPQLDGLNLSRDGDLHRSVLS